MRGPACSQVLTGADLGPFPRPGLRVITAHYRQSQLGQMAGFQAEKFHVSLVPEAGHRSERVGGQIGLDGLELSAQDGGHLYQKYPLNHISRWAIRSTNLVLFTKTPSDVEERTLTLHGSEHVVRSMLDTLTSSCMQCAPCLHSSGALQLLACAG